MVLLDQNVCIQTRSNVYGQRLFWRKQKIRQPLEKYQGQIIFIIKLFASISNTIKCFEHLEVEHSKDHTVQIYICTMTILFWERELNLLYTNYAKNLISQIFEQKQSFELHLRDQKKRCSWNFTIIFVWRVIFPMKWVKFLELQKKRL